MNTIAVGIIVFALAQLEYVALQRWEEVAGHPARAVADRLALPVRLFRRRHAQFYHSTLGGLVLLLAILQLWQDWGLSDRDMLKHGQ